MVRLSFDAWDGVGVAATVHSVTVLPPKAGPKAEPVAPNLIASLVHPERKASLQMVSFSPDGARLFAAGYPSGIVQFWDVGTRKEIRRIDTPPGYRGSANYALLTPDWKTLYVPVERRSVKPFEREGKRLDRIEYAGEIRVWDLASGKEKESLRPPVGWASGFAKFAPNGRFLVSIERPSYDTSDTRPKDVTAVWDIVSGRKWTLWEDTAFASFAPDSKTAVISLRDYEAKTSSVRLLDVATGNELARRDCPDKERSFSAGPVAPDGSVVVVYLGSVKKGSPIEVWFLDARTLEDRGKLTGKGDPERYGWTSGVFTLDSRQFASVDGAGNVLLWDVAEQRLVRTLPFGGSQWAWQLVLCPDGKTLAVGWMPKRDQELQSVLEPDPQDLPQPRVSLVDLSGKTPPRVLVAPHGYVGGLAFSPDGRLLAFGGVGAVHLFDLTR